MLYPLFRRIVLEKGLMAHGDRAVVAVSGGIDSMVLLDLICRLSRGMRFFIVAAHVNHKLRGKASDGDEELVRDAAKRLGVAFEAARRKPPRGKNLQDSARRLRYEFFAEVAGRHGAKVVCLAHHAGDQAETVLMHMLRGAGLSGLRGMACSSTHDGLRIVRPLLSATRQEIARYAKERRIEYREDETNAKLLYRRNSIRHRLIPLLREINPRIEEALSEMASRLADDDDAMNEVAMASRLEAALSSTGLRVELRSGIYREFPASIRRRMLRQAFASIAGSTKDLNSDQLCRMDEIACSAKSKGEYRLPAGCQFSKDGGIISIRK